MTKRLILSFIKASIIAYLLATGMHEEAKITAIVIIFLSFITNMFISIRREVKKMKAKDKKDNGTSKG